MSSPETSSEQGQKFVVFDKSGERYLFFYDSVDSLCDTFNRFANNPELSFTPKDAEALSKEVRGEKQNNITQDTRDQTFELFGDEDLDDDCL